MQTIEVSEGQCLTDIAMHYLGDAERVFEIMELNGLEELSVELVPETKLIVPDRDPEKDYVVKSFGERHIPASMEEVEIDEGIDFWIIEDDFVVQPG